MNTPNWGLIRSGATFEALLTSLVGMLEPRAQLFGRPGRDGGQDVKSADCRTVYQAKYNKLESAQLAITTAKSEIGTIATYLVPGHTNYPLWQGVKDYVFATNALFNAKDLQQWERDIVPKFNAQGLNLILWTQSNLNQLLIQFPDIRRAYFEAENRVFLSLAELQGRDDIFINARTLDLPIAGRTNEINELQRLLSDPQTSWLGIYGPGGCGKSRLLYEVGVLQSQIPGWQVFWANTNTMETARWFEAVNLDRDTLILLDEPDEKLLRQLLEQTRSLGVRKSWKLMMSVRSSRDPSISFLESTKLKGATRLVQLDALSASDAVDCARRLIEAGKLAQGVSGWKDELAKKIARISGNFPGFIVLCVTAVENLESPVAIPDSLSEMAREYLREHLETSEVKLNSLRWMALFSPLNREDGELVSTFSQAIGADSEEAALAEAQSWVKRGLAFPRGARNRILEIKPDVLRDTILMDWLAFSPGFGPSAWRLSGAANKIIDDIIADYQTGKLNSGTQSKLWALARVDFILARPTSEPDILAAYFSKLYAAFPNLSPLVKDHVVKSLQDVAPAATSQIIRLSEFIRKSESASQEYEILGRKFVSTFADLLDSTCNALRAASISAKSPEERRAILEELFELMCLPETTKEGPLSTNVAANVHRQVIEGGKEFRGEFLLDSYEIACEKIAQAGTHPNSAVASGISLFLRACFTLEFHPTWFDGISIHHARVYIGRRENFARGMQKVKEALWQALERSDCFLWSCQIWRVLAQAHRQDFYVSMDSSSALADLERAKQYIDSKSPNFEEILVARELWKKNLTRSDRSPELHEKSVELEQVFQAQPLAREFDIFLGGSSFEDKLAKARERVNDFCVEGTTAQELTDFFLRAFSSLGQPIDRSKVYRLLPLIIAFGQRVAEQKCIQQFSTMALNSPDEHLRVVGLEIAGRWIAAQADKEPDSAQLAADLMSQIPNKETQAELVVFSFNSRAHAQSMSVREYLRNLGSIFSGSRFLSGYLSIVAPMLNTDFEPTRAIIEDLLSELPRKDTDEAFLSILRSLVDEEARASIKSDGSVTQWFSSAAIRYGESYARIWCLAGIKR